MVLLQTLQYSVFPPCKVSNPTYLIPYQLIIEIRLIDILIDWLIDWFRKARQTDVEVFTHPRRDSCGHSPWVPLSWLSDWLASRLMSTAPRETLPQPDTVGWWGYQTGMDDSSATIGSTCPYGSRRKRIIIIIQNIFLPFVYCAHSVFSSKVHVHVGLCLNYEIYSFNIAPCNGLQHAVAQYDANQTRNTPG